MGNFHDALDRFGTALELPDEFKSALTSAYDEDISGADAKVSGLESSITEKDSTIEKMQQEFDSRLKAAKAANWDLLRNGNPGGGSSEPAENINNNNNVDEDEDDFNPHITIKDLFRKRS